MKDDLKERLRANIAPAHADCVEAADRIEALEAERDAAQAEVARLREAHDLVADIDADNGFPVEWIERARKYIAALGEGQ